VANGLPIFRNQVITPHDGLDAFTDAIRSIVRDWRFTRELAWRMFVRDTVATFRGSFLGAVWLVLPALANSLVWVFLSGTNVVSISSGAIPYPLFVFVGTLIWTAFNGSLFAALGCVEEAKGTLAKVNFPQETLVLVAVSKSILNVLVTALCLIPFLMLYPVKLHSGMWLFPVGVVVTLISGTAFGLILVPIAALFSDLGRAIHLGMRFVFFLTPVIFPLPVSGTGRMLMLWNPATTLVVTTRSWLLGGEMAMTGAFFLVGSVSVVLLIIGTLALKVALPHIVERMGGG
jgi:lipopolysaccharide transport system permease protein